MQDIGRDELVADGLMTVAEAANFLRISRSKLYSLMDQGQLAFVRLGQNGHRASRRIPRRALIEFAARHLHDNMAVRRTES